MTFAPLYAWNLEIPEPSSGYEKAWTNFMSRRTKNCCFPPGQDVDVRDGNCGVDQQHREMKGLMRELEYVPSSALRFGVKLYPSAALFRCIRDSTSDEENT